MRVLLLEDDAEMVELMRLLLGEMAGWEVVAFTSGAAALREVPRLGRVDLALIDLNMEPVSGSEVVHTLIERGQCAFPVVFLSGTTPSDEDLDLVEGFVRKPFTYDELMAQLRSLLGDRLS